jgi:hypothetical protein
VQQRHRAQVHSENRQGLSRRHGSDDEAILAPSGAGAAVPAEQVQELAPGLGAVGKIVRFGALAVRETLAGDAVGPGVLLDFRGADRVGAGRVQPEDLGAERRGDFRVAVPGAQLGRDLKGPKGLDLVLGRAVPNGVGAPENIVLPAILEELSERVRRRDRA